MRNWFDIRHLILLGLRKLLYLWVRTQIFTPGEEGVLALDPSKPVVYVLQRRFLPNALVLSYETEKLGMPLAWAGLTLADGRSEPSFFFLTHPASWWQRRKKEMPSALLSRLVAVAHEHTQFEVQIVPVTVLWGRAPEHQNSILKLIFSDGWRIRGTFKQMLTVFLHGRQTILRFNTPISLRQLVDESSQKGRDPAHTLRKLTRVLRVHFRRQREMAIGPDLSHRRTQIEALLDAPCVQAAIASTATAAAAAMPVKPGSEGLALAQARALSRATAKASADARKYAWEIASDYSYPMILIFARFMQWVWTRIYDGIEVQHVETVTKVAADHEIIYVPCHRSHIDYLLMSYIIFKQGLMVPHIAAGANLNFPVVGGILRRSGAFFLRRSFKGNHLYAAVFNEYLHMLIARGFPIEYFVEGGRSRSGRLLAPMGGMLAMSVHSFLRDAPKPIVFLPVYIGYEKLFEGRTYVSELLGKPKKKESLFDLLLTVRELKKNFGKAHVSFGEPIKLGKVLDQAHPGWRDEQVAEDERPLWLNAGIENLRQQIANAINATAVVNPVNLLSLVLLATPRQAMDVAQLARQLDAYRRLALAAPYAPRVTLAVEDGVSMIAYCEKLKLILRQPHELGDIVYFTPDEGVLATYARNNILHLFALPALLACLFAQNAKLNMEQLRALVLVVYPFLRAELFLRWTDEELEAAMQTALQALLDMGWLLPRPEDTYVAPPLNSDEYAQLALLGHILRPSLMRYFITLAMLTQHGSGQITPAKLESLCHLQAQRLSVLSEFNAPEFFDKAIFRTLIATLTQRQQIKVEADGNIHFDEALKEVANEAHYVLPPEVRQTILAMARQGGVALQQSS